MSEEDKKQNPRIERGVKNLLSSFFSIYLGVDVDVVDSKVIVGSQDNEVGVVGRARVPLHFLDHQLGLADEEALGDPDGPTCDMLGSVGETATLAGSARKFNAGHSAGTREYQPATWNDKMYPREFNQRNCLNGIFFYI